jgi:hypothetical protein
MLATSITLAAALLASDLVDVRSSTGCPSSENIAERLRPLLPAAVAHGSAPDIATIATTDARGADLELRIRLVRSSGAEVGDRHVVVQADCAEAAATVAAVIAAWETEPPPLASPDAAAPVATATAAPAVRAPPSAWRALVGAGGGIGVVGGVAGVGRVEFLVGKSASRLHGRVGLTGETSRTLSLPPGSVGWQHTTVEAGLFLRTLHPRWPVSLDAALTLGWATLEGHGFAPDRKQRSFDYGACAAVRLARSLGRWSVWAEARGYGWAQGQRASLTGANASADLPRVDVTASVGLSAPLIW